MTPVSRRQHRLCSLERPSAWGAVSGALADVGINDRFMKNLADKMGSGTSALFVLIRKATPDKVIAEIEKFGDNILTSSLSHEEEAKLQAALSPTATIADLKRVV